MHMEKIFIENCCEILDSMRIPITAENREKGLYPYYGANGIQDYVADYIFNDELVLLAEDGGNFGSKNKPIAYRVSGKCWVNNHAHVLKPKSGLNVDYLCYSLMFYKTDGMVNGATRQKLTQAAMRKMKIPFIPMDEQLNVVHKLNKITKIKEQREKELKLLDDIIRARFVEMFGDEKDFLAKAQNKVSDICKSRVGIVIQPTQYYTDEPNGVRAFRSLNVKPFYINDSDWVYFSESDNGQLCRTQVREGDVAVVRTGANLGDCCVIPKKYDGCNAIDILLLTCNDDILPMYLSAFINYPVGKQQIINVQRGGAIKHLNLKQLENSRIYVPEMELQQQFVNFVNQVDKSKVILPKSSFNVII